jgi:hypothetical protein
MNFKDTLTKLAEADRAGTICVSLTEALTIANLLSDPEVVRLTTPADVLAFARTLPEVTSEIAAGKKILAIKNLRAASENTKIVGPFLKSTPTSSIIGLKAAKDACDVLAAEQTAKDAKAFRTCPDCYDKLNEHTTWDRCPSNAHNHG